MKKRGYSTMYWKEFAGAHGCWFDFSFEWYEIYSPAPNLISTYIFNNRSPPTECRKIYTALLYLKE